MTLTKVVVSMLAVGAPGADAAPMPALAPRIASPKPLHVAQPEHASRLIVKFRDDLHVRSLAGRATSGAGADLRQVEAVAAAHGATFAPLLLTPPATLARLEQRAEQRSGVAAPDLGGMLRVHAPDGRLEALANELNALASVEFAYFAGSTPPPPSCEDAAPDTPGYVSMQTYRGPAPGLDIDAAWALGAARGAGLRVADVEYGYTMDHEDLCGVIPEPGQTVHPDVYTYGWDEHGTAVLGQVTSAENDYGCLGLTPEAEILFFPEWTVEEDVRRETAIANAIAAVEPGDIIMLEMQAIGDGIGYGPAELEPAVWLLTKTATDAGIIVVAAAGNGNEDLDSEVYDSYLARGDSGAIIVGAGSADLEHRKLSFSTFGSRVDLQGWGELVFTLGYGDFAEPGDDPNQRYTDVFAGTSSAVPFVAASCAAIQGLHEERYGTRLDPLALRQLLIDTGIPQGGDDDDGNIGPFPDIAAAWRTFCPADLDGSSVVDMGDVLLLLAAWGEPDALADIAPPGGDGLVDLDDLVMLLDAWGSCE